MGHRYIIIIVQGPCSPPLPLPFLVWSLFRLLSSKAVITVAFLVSISVLIIRRVVYILMASYRDNTVINTFSSCINYAAVLMQNDYIGTLL